MTVDTPSSHASDTALVERLKTLLVDNETSLFEREKQTLAEAAARLTAMQAELEEKTAENARNAEGFAFHAARAERERDRAIRAEAELARVTAERNEAEGINLLDGDGWVFWNPDSGEEYSPSHPVESGECEDAQNIRNSTAQEDLLWKSMQSEFDRAEAAIARAVKPVAFVRQRDLDGSWNSIPASKTLDDKMNVPL
ncbi:hypothetical protein EN802_33115, partial [bacterium M00.F.Ca.ET.159.01.1.1]